MTRTRVAPLSTALLSAVLLIASAARADQPDRGLLELVGADAGLVVEVSGLKREFPKLKDSDVFQRLAQTSVYRRWKSGPDFRNLLSAQKAVEGLVEKPLEQFVSELFGQSVVLAVYPVAKGESRTVFLTRASSGGALESAIAAWDRAERAESQTIPFGAHVYVRRTKTKPNGKANPPQFYVRFDDVLALSDSEPAIRRVIGLRHNRPPTTPETAGPPKIEIGSKGFLSTPAFREGRASLSPKRFISAYLNPRVWDAVLAADEKKSPGDEVAADLWRRCDWIAFGLRADGGLVLEMTARYDGSGLPAGWSRAIEAMSGPPEFLNRVPRRAAVVAVGRHDLAGAAKLLIGQIPDDKQDDWNRVRQIARGLLVDFDLFDDVLPAMGPGWGMYLVARRPESGNGLPPDGLLALQLPTEDRVKRGPVTLRDGLDNALKTGLRLLGGLEGVGHRPDQGQRTSVGPVDAPGPAEAEIVLHTTQDERGRLRWSEGDGPLRPAYALTPGYLAAGSSPEMLREFMALRPEDSLGSDPAFRRWSEQFFAGENQLLFVNVGELLGIVRQYRVGLAERLSASKSVSLEQAQQRIAEFEELMGTFDAAFVAGHVDTDRVRLVWGVAVR